MVTVIHADRFEMKDEPLDRLSDSGGPRLSELTTEGILKAMHEISARPEMRELDRLMMEGPGYLRGHKVE